MQSMLNLALAPEPESGTTQAFRPKIGRPPAVVTRMEEAKSVMRAPRRNGRLIAVCIATVLVSSLILGRALSGSHPPLPASPAAMDTAALSAASPSAGGAERFAVRAQGASLVGGIALMDKPETPVSVYSAGAADAPMSGSERKQLLTILSKD